MCIRDRGMGDRYYSESRTVPAAAVIPHARSAAARWRRRAAAGHAPPLKVWFRSQTCPILVQFGPDSHDADEPP
eukprot:8636743-Prorocentrum_lima.AAC.1